MGSVRFRHGKKNSKWVLDYVDQHGQRRLETTDWTRPEDRDKAVKLLGDRERVIKKGEYQAPEDQARRFEELIEKYKKAVWENLRETSRKDYGTRLRHIENHFRGVKIQAVDLLRVEEFKDSLLTRLKGKRKGGRRTVNKCLVMLGALFKYGIKIKWALHNPARDVEKLKADTGHKEELDDDSVLTTEEIKKLLEAFDRSDPQEYRWALMILTALMTGLREGEIFGLTWNDVDWNRKQVKVRQQIQAGRFYVAKTKSSRRSVDVPKVLMRELVEWRVRCPKGKHDLVFPNGAGGPENHGNLLNRGFYPALRRAGIKRIRFHDLRHSYASLLIENGEHPKYIQAMLGHSSIKTTMDVYGHRMNKVNPEAADKLARLAFEKFPKPRACDKSVTNRVSDGGTVSEAVEILGAEGQNRTADTRLFRPLLYRLSYLGTGA